MDRHRRGMGRPSKFTPQVAEGIILAVRAGAPLRVAAGSQGIAETTFLEWMRRGEGLDIRPSTPDLAQFARDVRRAAEETHVRIVGTITQAAFTDHRAALAWIRLRYPEVYAERTELSGPGGGPIATEIAAALDGMTDDELTAVRRRLAGPADRSGAGTP